MNKKLFLAASLLAVSGMLAACGSDEASEVATEETVTETEVTEETGQEDSAEESVEEDAEEGSSSAETTENSEQAAEENPVVSEGALTVSESQSYELYLLPNYTFTAEEPNKDVIYSTESDELFMRVETFNAEEFDWEAANESIQQTLQASNESAELTPLPAFEESEFTNSAVYEIPTENGKVTGAVFEKDGLIAKLTIFDLTDAGVTEEFLNMGKTITPVN